MMYFWWMNPLPAYTDKELHVSLSVFRIDIISQYLLLVRSFFAIQTMIKFMTCCGW